MEAATRGVNVDESAIIPADEDRRGSGALVLLQLHGCAGFKLFAYDATGRHTYSLLFHSQGLASSEKAASKATQRLIERAQPSAVRIFAIARQRTQWTSHRSVRAAIEEKLEESNVPIVETHRATVDLDREAGGPNRYVDVDVSGSWVDVTGYANTRRFEHGGDLFAKYVSTYNRLKELDGVPRQRRSGDGMTPHNKQPNIYRRPEDWQKMNRTDLAEHIATMEEYIRAREHACGCILF